MDRMAGTGRACSLSVCQLHLSARQNRTSRGRSQVRRFLADQAQQVKSWLRHRQGVGHAGEERPQALPAR